MDRLRHKQNITKEGLIDFSRTLCSIFYSPVAPPAITMILCILRILNNLCSQALEEKTLMQ
jgi:hypothetical protein